MGKPIDAIMDLMMSAGAARYGMEPVNQLQHARQCAALAAAEDAPEALIAAAFLHDIGHVVDGRFEGAIEAGVDRRHEEIGAACLSRQFGPDVSEPVRLHVAAKRYLCATEPGYLDTLSLASKRSLALQGGAFTAVEADAFMEQPHAAHAVRLRRWDDVAKDPEFAGMPLPLVRRLLERLVRQ